MPNRFWVGGSGDWNASSTTNWSATSGGAPGASAPTSVDDVFFDAASGSPTVTPSGAVCRSWTHTAGVATFDFSFSPPVQVWGSITWWASTNIVGPVAIRFFAESGTHTINLAGKNLSPTAGFAGAQLDFGASPFFISARWNLAGTFNFGAPGSGGVLTLSRGTLDTAGVAIQNLGRLELPQNFQFVTLILGASAVGTAAVPLNEFRVTNNLLNSLTTLTLGTSVIFADTVDIRQNLGVGGQFVVATSSAGHSMNKGTGGPTSGSFTYEGGSSSTLQAINGYASVNLASKFNALTVGAISQTVTGVGPTLNTYGTGSVTIASMSQTASPVDNPCTATFSGGGASVGAITQSAAPSALSVASRVVENCTGTFTVIGTITSQDVEMTGSAVASLATITLLPSSAFGAGVRIARSAATTTGAITANQLRFESSANITTGSVTSIASNNFGASLSITMSTGALNIASLAAGSGGCRWAVSLFGSPTSFTCGGASLVSMGGAASGTTAVSFTAPVFIADDPVTGFSASPLSLSQLASVSFTSLNATGVANTSSFENTFSGCGTVSFSSTATGNSALSFSFSDTNFTYPVALTVRDLLFFGSSSPRTINLTNATVNVTRRISIEESAVVTSTGSTINLVHDNTTTTQVVFEHGGKSYNAVTATGTNISLFGFGERTMTVASFSRTGAANNFSQLRLASTDLVCSGALTLQGNSAINRLFVFSNNDGNPATITAATRTLSNVDFRFITAAGGSLPWALGTSVGDCQGNTNITFTPSVTRYAVASGAWNSTSVWASFSGGPGGASVPLPQDDVQFTAGSGAISVTTGTVRALGRNMFVSNFTGSLLLNRSPITSGAATLVEIYGDVEIAVGSNISSSSTKLVTRKVGTGTFLNSSSVADFSLVSGNTERLTLSMVAGLLQELVLLSGETVLSATGTINSVNENPNTGPEDAYNLSTRVEQPPSLSFGSSVLTINNIAVDFAVFSGGTSSVTLPVTSALTVNYWSGSLNNLIVRNTLGALSRMDFFGSGSNGVAGTFSTAGSTHSTIFAGRVTFTGSGRFSDFGTASLPAILSMQVINNTASHLETQFAYCFGATTSGTKALPRLVAFGATNLGLNSGISFPTPVKVAAFSEGFEGTWELPNDFGGTYYAVAYGAGGQGGRNASAYSGSAGGGGGAYAMSAGLSPLGRGQLIQVRAPAATGPRTTTGDGIKRPSAFVAFSTGGAPSTAVQGALADSGTGGGANGFSGAGGLGASSVGLSVLGGGRGGSGGGASSFTGGGGGGAPASAGVVTATPVGGNGSFGSLYFPGAGGGGAGTTSSGGNAGTNGGNGGNPSGGTAGTSRYGTPRAGADALATSSGGGGGAGAETVLSYVNAPFFRNQGSNSLDITAAQGLNSAFTYVAYLQSATRPTGTYTRAGSLVTCTLANHGLVQGQSAFVDFLSGTALDGTYFLQTATTNQFTFNTVASGSTSGSFVLGTLPVVQDYTVTVVSSNTLRITTAANNYIRGTLTLYLFPLFGGGSLGFGGNSGMSSIWTTNYYNGALSTVTRGTSGGGGGGGGITTSSSSSTIPGGAGGSSLVGGGGGGGGSGKTQSGDGGSGGAALVVFVYASAVENIETQIIL